MIELKKSKDFAGPKGPVVLVIMDGIGIGKNPESDYVKQAQHAKPRLVTRKRPAYRVAGSWYCGGTTGRWGYGKFGGGS